MTDTTTPKTRTITLTDRAPVRIREDEWPVIAEAHDDSWTGHRGDGRYHQAVHEGALDEYTLKVRQHQSGTGWIIYGILKAATFVTAPGVDWRGGVMLDGDVADLGDVAREIRHVGQAGGLPDHVIRECIADLPAEEI